MISLWKAFRSLSAMSGIVMLCIAANSSDYYVLELGMNEPSGVRNCMIIGVLMLLPMLAHTLYDLYIEGKVAEEIARRELEKEEE
jgi:hypothetical protein